MDLSKGYLPDEIDVTSSEEKVTPPENTEDVIPPVNSEQEPPKDTEDVIPPKDTEETAPPENTEDVIPPVNSEQEPPKDTEEVIPPVNSEETAPSLSDESVLKYLSDKLGKEVSFDSLIPKEEDDPYIIKLKEWRDKTGRPIEDWVKYNRDVESMSVEEILREKITTDYPDLTEDQIEQELDSYMILEDDDEDTQKRKELNLAKELPSIKEALKNKSLVFGDPVDNLPKEFKDNYDAALNIVEQNRAINEQQQKDTELIIESIKGLSSLTLDLNGEKKLDFTLGTEQKDSILNYVEKPASWVNTDGSFNANQMLKDAAIVNNFEAIVKMVYQQGLDEGLLSKIDSSPNATEPNIKNNETTTTKTTSYIEGYDEMMGKQGFGFRRIKK